MFAHTLIAGEEGNTFNPTMKIDLIWATKSSILIFALKFDTCYYNTVLAHNDIQNFYPRELSSISDIQITYGHATEMSSFHCYLFGLVVAGFSYVSVLKCGW